MSDLSGRTTIVVGASRGLGHGVATAFAQAGAPVVAVSRTSAEFESGVDVETADAASPTVADSLISRHEPEIIVVVAGAVPHMRSLQEQTWSTFSVNWENDVQLTFHWLRAALLTPLRPGSRVVVVSSGAVLNPGGSPLSGGYAGAKAMQRFMTGYAQGEADRAGLGLSFSTVLPRFAPTTGVGEAAVAAYAAQAGMSVEEFLGHQGPLLDPAIAGEAMVELALVEDLAPAYGLSGAGLQKLS